MKKNRTVAVLLLIGAVVCYILSAVAFFRSEVRSDAVALLGLGSGLLCFGTVYMNKKQ